MRVRVVMEIVKSNRLLLHHVSCLAYVKLPPDRSLGHVRWARDRPVGSTAKSIIIRCVITMDSELWIT